MTMKDDPNDDSYIEDILSSIFHNTENDIKDNHCQESDSLDAYIFSSDIRQKNTSFVDDELSELYCENDQDHKMKKYNKYRINNNNAIDCEPKYKIGNNDNEENIHSYSSFLASYSQAKESNNTEFKVGRVNEDSQTHVLSLEPDISCDKRDFVSENEGSFFEDDISSAPVGFDTYKENVENLHTQEKTLKVKGATLEKEASCTNAVPFKNYNMDNEKIGFITNTTLIKEITTGFTTGNNKVIKIKEDSLLKAEDINQKILNDANVITIHKDLSNAIEKTIQTGFTTGNNKIIKIKEDSLLKAEDIKRTVFDSFNCDKSKKNISNKDNEILMKKKNDSNVNNDSDEKDENTTKTIYDEKYYENEFLSNQSEHETANHLMHEVNAPEFKEKIDEETELDLFFKKRKLKDGNNATRTIATNQNIKTVNCSKEEVNTNNNKFSSITNVKNKKPNEHYDRFQQKNRPMRSYLRPEVGHVTTDINYFTNCQTIYDSIKKENTNFDKKKLFQHFKWSWMSLFIKNKDNITKDTINVEIRKRIQREYSILRRIVEGDDISQKYMCLLIISAKDKCIEVFDGHYSVKSIVDNELQKMIISQKLKCGTFLHVMNAELLVENKAFFDVSGNVLKLCYNSTAIAQPKKLGYQSKIGFCTYLKQITRTGGVISGLELQVFKIIESKITIKVGNYVNTVDEKDFEKEIESIETMMREANNQESYKPIINRYTKLNLKDKYNKICILTWSDCEDIKVNDIYRFINLKIVQKSTGLHLLTHKQTYVKKIKELR